MITKPLLNKFRTDFAEAVKMLEAEYKVKIALGTISYSETSFHSKITVTESSLAENGSVVVSETHFKKCAKMLGVPETWYNLEFNGSGNERLKIVGLNPRKPKNSVELISVVSGKQYQGSIEFVQYQLGKQSAKMAVITKDEYLKLSVEDKKMIEDIYNDLSPENLTCDGELSRAEVNRKSKFLNSKLNVIQNRLNRIIPEEVIYA